MIFQFNMILNGWWSYETTVYAMSRTGKSLFSKAIWIKPEEKARRRKKKVKSLLGNGAFNIKNKLYSY